MNGGQEVFDSFLGNLTDLKSEMAFRGECVGIEGNERVFGLMLLEGIVKGEEAGKVSRICYQSSPDLYISVFYYRLLGCQSYLSLSSQRGQYQDELSQPCPCLLFTYVRPRKFVAGQYRGRGSCCKKVLQWSESAISSWQLAGC